ncbi:HAD family hydrolase [Gryllotalpicola reticulitermitis]|uniref:HAD family hydrolase n=1 Tax=Gryllotalpicola reticulitermitis TaxID=1184153 RepID=A0ABV8Q5R9_9MICO
MSGVAFFDVDETLVSVRTLESFLMAYLKEVPSMISMERLQQLAKQVVELDREEFNRIYFAIWAGQPVEQVLEIGERWYAANEGTSGFYRPNVLGRLRKHQADGDRVVLVSGSFAAPLRPIAAAVGADHVFCTELEVAPDGTYTGVIAAAMIGEDKRRAVESYLAELTPGSAPLADSSAPPVQTWGYGDHPSDLALLEGVTDPVVVGSDPAMLAVAQERGWPVWPIDQPLAPRG